MLNVSISSPLTINATAICERCADMARQDNLAFVWFFLFAYGAYHLRSVILNSGMTARGKTRYARALYISFNLFMLAGFVWWWVIA